MFNDPTREQREPSPTPSEGAPTAGYGQPAQPAQPAGDGQPWAPPPPGGYPTDPPGWYRYRSEQLSGRQFDYGVPPPYRAQEPYGAQSAYDSPPTYGAQPPYTTQPGYGYGSPTSTPPEPRPAGMARSPRWLPVALLAALIGALVGGGIGAAVAHNTSSTKSPAIVREVVPANTPIAKPQSVPAILTKVEPGVVSVQTNLGAGTGMILTPDGQVLTNYHVIQGASSIKVTLFNDTAGRSATVRGFDRSNDVALLQITGASGLPVVQLGDSDALQVGDDVIAVGNALNLAGGPTVTSGIISAKGRTVDPTAPSNLLQTDAAINPGNSGGPLVDGDGKVVGMNTLVIQQANSQEAAQNLGFAIPINTIKPLVPDLANGVQRTPGYLGVGVVTLTPDIAQRFGITVTQGAIIQDLAPDGPAARAGLQQSDVIVSFDGQKVTSDSGLVQLIHAHKPGDKVPLTYARGNSTKTVTVTLGTPPSQ